MRSLVTLYRRDLDFASYIDGSFSKTHRAVPVRSLNVNSELEQVTFEIIPVEEIEKPGFFKYWSQIFKLRNFMMLAFPAVLIINKNYLQNSLHDVLTMILSLLGALFLMTSANLRNDWSDYVNGVDRIHPQSGGHALQKGWTTAREVYFWSIVYLILGILFGLPAVFKYPKVLIFVAVLAVVGILGMSSFKSGLKYRRWSEFAVFLLLGPCFTLGLQVSMGAHWDFQSLFIGVMTGWMSAFYLHIKNFQEMMVNEQAKFINTLSWLGFESGKKFVFAWWFVFSLMIAVYQGIYSDVTWLALFVAGGLVTCLLLFRSLKGIPSPLSSRVKKVVEIGKCSLVLMTCLILLQTAYFAWILNAR